MKKRFLSIGLIVVMILSSFPLMSVSATDTYSSNGWTYELNNGVAEIVGYTGSATDITIPSTLDGYAVEKIQENAFKNSQLTSVRFPQTLKEVDWYAFRDSTKLTTIYVDSGYIDFDSYGGVFQDCSSLTNIIFAEGIDKIPNGVAQSVSSLKQVNIPDSVTEIGNKAFSGTGLTSIKFPKYLEKVGQYAFKDCDGLTSVELPKNLKNVDYGAFMECDNLNTINIPKKAVFGEGVFENCSNLSNITFDTGRTEIDYAMFRKCTGLKSLNIPVGITKIKSRAFDDCSNLESVTIPSSVTTIEWATFRDCTKLNNIVIPNSVTYFADNIFKGCTGLTNITLPNKITRLNNATFSGCSSLKSIVLPDSITNICDSAFYGCSSLENIKLPKNLVGIGEFRSSQSDIFYGCSSLKNIEIPATVTHIGYGSFNGCSSLKSIVIPYGVEEIKKETFKWCKSLSKVTIPSTVTKIDSTAFTYYGETTVRCVKGSAADLYAQEYDMPVEYMVEKVDISAAQVNGVSNSYNYTGKAITPNVTVKFGDTVLTKSVDYTVSYSNNTNAGTATINITGIGKYEGNLAKTFNIARINMSKTYISLSATKYTYNQDAKKPSVTAKYSGMTLKNGTDYTLKYSNNINAGTASVIVTGKGNYTGSITKNFTINKKSISQTSIKLSKTTFTYNKKTQTPSVTIKLNGIKLKNGIDYTVSYKNIKIGESKVTITGKGNYSGKITKSYKIKIGTPKINKITTKSRKVTLKYSKITGAKSYEIYYSTKESSGFKKLGSTSKTTFTSKKLTKNTKYYFKIKAYSKISDKKYYSSYSSVKNIKVK